MYEITQETMHLVLGDENPQVFSIGQAGPPGPLGPQGIQGLQGLQGVPGTAGVGLTQPTYIFTQASALATWVINHMLGKMPSVTVVDSAGTTVEGEVKHDSNTQVTITFSSAFSGFAYLN